MPRFSDEAKNQLSCDQKYRYEIVSAVETDYVSKRLANLYPGKMTHSRWLTTANKVIRLYVSVSKPSDTLKKTANFVATIYASSWFIIKLNPQAQSGPKTCKKF